MFEVSWSELLIFAVVTLIFVGPKDLPVFLNTVGRYAGMLRRQAAEFRAHFDAAMREAELDRLRDEVAAVGRDVQGSMSGAVQTTDEEMRRLTDTARLPDDRRSEASNRDRTAKPSGTGAAGSAPSSKAGER